MNVIKYCDSRGKGAEHVCALGGNRLASAPGFGNSAVCAQTLNELKGQNSAVSLHM